MVLIKLQQIVRLHFIGEEKECHVANNLAGRRNFHDVAEQLIHFGVSFLHFAPAMAQTHEAACSRKFVNWPPGISCSYKRAEPAFGPESKGR